MARPAPGSLRCCVAPQKFLVQEKRGGGGIRAVADSGKYPRGGLENRGTRLAGQWAGTCLGNGVIDARRDWGRLTVRDKPLEDPENRAEASGIRCFGRIEAEGAMGSAGIAVGGRNPDGRKRTQEMFPGTSSGGTRSADRYGRSRVGRFRRKVAAGDFAGLYGRQSAHPRRLGARGGAILCPANVRPVPDQLFFRATGADC